MKYSQLSGFEKHLLAAAPQNLSPLYVILAKDENERTLAIGKLKKQMEESLQLSLQSFHAKENKEEEIFLEIETLSFLQPAKAVHICEMQHLNKAVLERLEKFFAKPPKGLYLILSGSDLKGHASFYKKAEKYGVILDIAEEKPWEKEKTLQEWLIKEAALLGKNLHPTVAQLFIKALGSDVLLLQAELNKLCCYTGERREISGDDVKAITSLTHQETSWQLGDALFKRNSAMAFRLARGILAQDIPFFVLLRSLRTQFQTAFQLTSLQNSSDEFPHLKESTVEKYRAQAREYGISNMPNALQTIDEIEWLAKNGEDRYDFLSDFLILKLTV